MKPGEYSQPLPRKTFVQVPVISGYVASRLRRVDSVSPVISGGETNMLVTFENVGPTQFAVLLRETDDRSISGTRYNLMSAVSVVPGGQYTSQLTGGVRPFLEVFCTGTTTGFLRLQIDSQTTWNELGFAKDDPFYPTSLWQAKVVPPATT